MNRLDFLQSPIQVDKPAYTANLYGRSAVQPPLSRGAKYTPNTIDAKRILERALENARAPQPGSSTTYALLSEARPPSPRFPKTCSYSRSTCAAQTCSRQ